MDKVLLCNIHMFKGAKKTTYTCEDKFFPVADTQVRYPVGAFYEKTLKPGDTVRAVLLAKMDEEGDYKNNIEMCRAELDEVCRKTGATIEADVIYTPFKEDMQTHGDLLKQIIDKVGLNAELTVDMTYGPKDMVVVLFTALNFLEKFCGCEVANVIFGQIKKFENGVPVGAEICEMAPLYYISKLMNDIECSDPAKAVNMLKVLLDM